MSHDEREDVLFGIDGGASSANNGNNDGDDDKIQEKQSTNQAVNTHQGPNLREQCVQGVLQDPILEWTRDHLERRRYEPYDTAGDITKKLKMEVPDFVGNVDPTVFSDWLASIK